MRAVSGNGSMRHDIYEREGKEGARVVVAAADSIAIGRGKRNFAAVWMNVLRADKAHLHAVTGSNRNLHFADFEVSVAQCSRSNGVWDSPIPKPIF